MDLMSNWPVAVAMVLSFVWCGVHLVWGGKDVAGPLRRVEGLDHTIMATMWMVWHMVTAVLFLMGVFFAMGLVWGAPYVVSGTLLAGAIAAAGIAVVPLLGTSFKVLPQGWLFVPVAALGVYALLG